MSTKCCFCGNRAMSDTENLDLSICMDCAAVEAKANASRKVWEARQALNDSLKALTKTKFKDEPLRITNVFIFSNGNTAVTDQYGDQMPYYQGKWEDVHDKIYQAIEGQDTKPMLHDNYNVGWMLK